MTDPFELAFAEDLESAEKFQVWLDTLDEREDLVGEYLSLAFATETSPPADKATRARMWKRLRQLRTAHAAEWFGVTPTEDDWRWGIARGLRLAPTMEAVERCLTSRLGRFVTDFWMSGDLDDDVTRALVQRFASHRSLRGLTLATSIRGAVFPMGVLPLRRLALRAFSLDDSATMKPGLEALTLEDVTFPERLVDVLSQPAASLRLFTIDGAPALTQQLTLRLSTRSHPALERLSVEVVDGDGVVAHFVASGMLDGLKALTVDGPLTDAGLAMLSANTARFAALETLTLDWRQCSEALVRQVIPQFPRISLTRRIDASAWID